MRKFIAAALALSVLATSKGVAQQVDAKISEIAVTGRGEVRIEPDRAIILATVVTNASTATTAASDNARIVAEVMARLKAVGLGENQVTNGGYSLGQDFEFVGNTRRFRGFVARNTVRVDLRDVSLIGKVIDAAIAGGATEISPISFSGPDMQKARRDALKIAVAEARRDAETLADASGGTLGRLLSLSSGVSQPAFRVAQDVVATGVAESTAGGTTIRANDLVVSAMASGRWEFIPRR